MINTILTYDNQDENLGDFFDRCATATKEGSNPDFNIHEINSQALNELNIQLRVNQVNDMPFLFVSFTHGSENKLLKAGKVPFISDTINASCLKNSFAYCFACHAGKKLGNSIIENGAMAFLGFKDELKIQKFFDAFDCFIDCSTSGILFFISGYNLSESVEQMKKRYTDYVDQFYLKDMILASWFMEHRDALVLLGKTDISISDFYIQ